jgi:intein/homing endonuclease
MGEYLAGENLEYKPPKPSEREVREDIDDLYEDLPLKVKEHFCIDKVIDIRKDKYVKDIYSLYVPRWHSFQLNSGIVVSNCDELNVTGQNH